MRLAIFVVMLLVASCADAKSTLVPPPPVVEKVSEAELLAYKAAFLNFKALEAAIVEKYKIDAAGGEVFDADTAVIHRKKKAPPGAPPLPPHLLKLKK